MSQRTLSLILIFMLCMLSASVAITSMQSSDQSPSTSGTAGMGATTPGIAGGIGAGGNPADTDISAVCRDPETGELRPGRSDQFGYCI